MGPLAYSLWIALAVITQLNLALWGILSRYLQTKPDTPAPALRLVLVISMLAESTLILFNALPTAALQCYRRRRKAAAGGGGSPAGDIDDSQVAATAGRPAKATAAAGSGPASPTAELACKATAAGEDGGSTADSSESSLVAAVHDVVAAAGASELLAAQQQQQQQPEEQQHQEQVEEEAGRGPVLPIWRPPGAAGVGVLSRQGGLAAAEGPTVAAAWRQSPFEIEQGQPPGAGLAAELLRQQPAGGVGAGDAHLPAGDQSREGEEGDLGLGGGGGSRGSALAQAGGSSRHLLLGRSLSVSSLRAKLRRQRTTVRPEVALKRGLSRRFEDMQSSRPGLSRFLALATLTVSFAATCGLQLTAPGFVDPSLVQLVGQFTAIGTALAQAGLLRQRLPWVIWPCIAVMTGGAAMVIVPSLGQSEAGSLSSARGWLGFGLAVAALAFTVIYFLTLQATRHMGYSSSHLTHYFLGFSILVFLALSLPIDGSDWRGQFGGWAAGDWLILAFESSVAYVGSAAAMQHCVWRLGAPLVSMFFGLRLVFTVALVKPILGATVIQTGVQIAGIIITAGSITTYVGHQWWQSRQGGLGQPPGD